MEAGTAGGVVYQCLTQPCSLQCSDSARMLCLNFLFCVGSQTSLLLLHVLQDLKSSTPAQYSPHALPELHTEWEGPKIGHDELVEKDGVMVYKQVRIRQSPGRFRLYMYIIC